MVTRDEVILGYRCILGRHPESDEAINSHTGQPTIEDLGRVLWQSQEFRNLYKTLQPLWPTSKWLCTPILEGLMIWVDLHDSYVSYGCLTGMYEASETAFISSILKPGDCFIDCGANIGWFTLLAARLVGPSGSVIAFEPRSDIYAMLKRSVAMNGFDDRCHLNCLAVGKDTRRVQLQIDMESINPGGTHLAEMAHSGGSGISPSRRFDVVEMRPLDEFLTKKPVTLIKLDVEGAEPGAVSGAEQILTRDHPVVVSEIFEDLLSRVSGMCAADFCKMLVPYGYEPFEIVDGRIAAPIAIDHLARANPYNVAFLHSVQHRHLLRQVVY